MAVRRAVRLHWGGSVLEVSAALAERARPRLDLAPFRTKCDETRGQRLSLEEGDLCGEGTALGVDEPGAYVLRQDALVVQSSLSTERFAEAALKVAFSVLAHRLGGLLLHASAVAFPGGAFLAVGASGAGKSTLARLSVEVGGALLSDETVALFPDGTLLGTPFRSDFEAEQGALHAPMRALLALEKGEAERLTPVPEAEAVERLLAQAYRPAPGVLGAADLLSRATTLAHGMQRFTFRKHPDAGRFWAQRLSSAAGA